MNRLRYARTWLGGTTSGFMKTSFSEFFSLACVFLFPKNTSVLIGLLRPKSRGEIIDNGRAHSFDPRHDDPEANRQRERPVHSTAGNPSKASNRCPPFPGVPSPFRRHPQPLPSIFPNRFHGNDFARALLSFPFLFSSFFSPLLFSAPFPGDVAGRSRRRSAISCRGVFFSRYRRLPMLRREPALARCG